MSAFLLKAALSLFKVHTTRSVAVSIMQFTCGFGTWCGADNVAYPLALLQESPQLPELWERALSLVLVCSVHSSSAVVTEGMAIIFHYF